MMGVTYIDYYIPGNELSIESFLDQVSTEAVPGSFKDKQEYAWFIENILKLKSVRVEPQLDEVGMVAKVIDKMFQTQDIKPEEIDLIVFAQDLEYVIGQNLAKHIQHRHGMIDAFTVNVTGNHCANIDVALGLVNQMAQDNSKLKNILIVGVKLSKDIDARVFGTYGVLGDAAGIMLVRNNPAAYKIKLIDNEMISDGSFHCVDLNTDKSVVHCNHYVKIIGQLMENNHLKPGQVKQVVIQNANPLLISQCLASKGLGNDILFSANQGKYGHLDCLDFLINLKDVLAAQKVKTGDYILSFGTGYAGTYVASLLEAGES